MIFRWQKFYEIQLRLDGANENLARLKKILGASPTDDPANVIVDDFALSSGHFLQQSFDIITARIRYRIGLIVYDLRSALNYMTAQLAERDCGKIGPQVQFPIESSPKGFAGHRPTYLEGLSNEHAAFIESFQPYNGANWMKPLRDLSNMDKHRGLVKVWKTAHSIQLLSPQFGADRNILYRQHEREALLHPCCIF